MGEHNHPKRQVATEGKARLMQAEILADWANNVVLIQEKAKEGIQLIQPQVFVIPMDIFMGTAFQLGLHKLQRDGEERAKSKLGIGPN